MTIEDLNDYLYNEFVDKCFNTGLFVDAFIAENYEKFEYSMLEKGKDPDYWCDYEYDFCDNNIEDYISFCADKLYGAK